MRTLKWGPKGQPGDEGSRKDRASVATATGGVVAALVSSVCCLGPLLLAAVGVGVGATGFWAGTAEVMKALLPYRPLFIVVAVVSLLYSFYLVYRKPQGSCEAGTVCEPAAQQRMKWVLWGLAGLALVLMTAPYWLGL
ncbi:MAG: mercuric transporter MerT family protein [Nitrospira sp.]|nr:mercuric transporter MerT family protein [Nitrospira sp.]